MVGVERARISHLRENEDTSSGAQYKESICEQRSAVLVGCVVKVERGEEKESGSQVLAKT